MVIGDFFCYATNNIFRNRCQRFFKKTGVIE